MQDLPPEMLKHLLKFLYLKDLCSLELLNKTIYSHLPSAAGVYAFEVYCLDREQEVCVQKYQREAVKKQLTLRYIESKIDLSNIIHQVNFTSFTIYLDRGPTYQKPAEELRRIYEATPDAFPGIFNRVYSAETGEERLLIGDESTFFCAHFKNVTLVGIAGAKIFLGCKFEGVIFEGDFRGAQFFWSIFKRSTGFNRADFTKADFRMSEFIESPLERGRLKSACLAGVNLTQQNFEDMNLEKAILRGAILKNANLIRTSLQSTDLEGASLEGTLLFRTNLFRANLRGVDLSKIHKDSKIEGRFLYQANLKETNFSALTLHTLDLSKMNLQNAIFNDARLIEVNFGDANLREVNFEGATLEKVNLEAAILRGAHFDRGTIFKEVRFRRVQLQGSARDTVINFLMAVLRMMPKAYEEKCDATKRNINEKFCSMAGVVSCCCWLSLIVFPVASCFLGCAQGVFGSACRALIQADEATFIRSKNRILKLARKVGYFTDVKPIVDLLPEAVPENAPPSEESPLLRRSSN